jgi:hypothetical protein
MMTITLCWFEDNVNYYGNATAVHVLYSNTITIPSRLPCSNEETENYGVVIVHSALQDSTLSW